MTPDFPFLSTADSFYIQFNPPIPCSMLRFDSPCGNDADMGFLMTFIDGTYRLAAMCDMCMHDIDTPGNERREYWRQFSEDMRS